jgi:SNF2 family DNA or RNA helicase
LVRSENVLDVQALTADIPPLFDHQRLTADKLKQTPILFDTSDPGTGKTRAHLQALWERRQAGGGKCLVVATKSTLQPAWGNDIDRFFPGMTYSIAYAHNRERAFKQNVDVYITNHDAVKWLAARPQLLAGFDTIIIDESTAFKNPNAQRSKALRKLAKLFKHRELLTGTPNPNSITEVWHQVLLLDDGQRLGQSFYKFRLAVCEPRQVGPRPEMLEWVDKPGADAAVFDLLSDISIRHKFEECVSIPENFVTGVYFDLPKTAQRAYDEMERDAMITLGEEEITAVNAASVTQKLLQIAAGAMYDGTGGYVIVDEGRTELVLDLIEERQHCLVAFLWKHQRDLLLDGAKARGISYAVIDGDVKSDERTDIVAAFQAGKIKVLFAHPQSAGHGLTLTKGTSTIWTSPTWNAEHYEQFNRRIYRAGQTERTETVHVCAKSTLDERVYAVLQKKVTGMNRFRELLEAA